MPLCTLHLLALTADATPEAFLAALRSAGGAAPLFAARVHAPVIRALALDGVLLSCTPWSLLLLLPAAATPVRLRDDPALARLADVEYVVTSGVPSRLLGAYAATTRRLNAAAQPRLQSDARSPARTVPGKVPSTSQNLEPSPELDALIERLDRAGTGEAPVCMLNLLAFRKSKEDVARYHEYGQQFNKVAAPFGGEPKILGSVVKPPAQATAAGSYPDSRGRPDRTEPWWDEISIVHYPSLRQFNDMASSSAYQGINRELRLPSLRDTTIICTQEIPL